MVYLFRKQGYKLRRLFRKSLKFGKNLKSTFCLAKETHHISFYAHVHACSPNKNPADIKIADIHRLPQWPIYVNNKRIVVNTINLS